MKIWLINQYAVPADRPGGTRHYSFAKGWNKLGHQTTLVSGSFNHFDHQQYPVKKDSLFHWIPTKPYSGNGLSRILGMFDFAQKIWGLRHIKTIEKPDIIIGSTPHLFAALSSYRLAQHWGIPFVLEVRDIWPQTLIDIGSVKPYHPFVLLLRFIEKYLYKHADHIITLLKNADQHINSSVKQAPPISTIPNGFDFSLLNGDLIQPQSINQDQFTITYAGSHGIANSLDDIIDAAVILQDKQANISIQFIGEGSEKQRLIQKAQTHSLQNVVFKDQVPKDELFPYLKRSDAFIMTVEDSPLYRFGFSMNKIFDYMSMGRPTLISTNIKENPISLSEGGIMSPANDPQSLAENILKLAKNSEQERISMGQKAYEYIKKYHDINMLSQKYLEILIQVAQKTILS